MKSPNVKTQREHAIENLSFSIFGLQPLVAIYFLDTSLLTLYDVNEVEKTYHNAKLYFEVRNIIVTVAVVSRSQSPHL